MNPHNFILHLRNHHPWGARLLDGIKGLGLSGTTLEIKIDTTRWPGTELILRIEEFKALASKFFDKTTEVTISHSPSEEERLPFPITATKYWNHIAFLHLGDDGALGLYGLRKTSYSEMLKNENPSAEENIEVFTFARPSNATNVLESHLGALPEILDLMAATARAHASYVQLVTTFPGHANAEALEGRYCSIKEWGTPITPPAILQKYAGRIHYLKPDATHRGLALARNAVKGAGH